MIGGAAEGVPDPAGPGPRLAGQWVPLREVWDELPVLLVANLVLAVGLVPAVVLWGAGSLGPALVTGSIVSSLFWTYLARRVHLAAGPHEDGQVRSSSLARVLGRSAGVGAVVGVLATSAALAIRWAATGRLVAIAVAVVTCCESIAMVTWALEGLRRVAQGESIRSGFRAAAALLRRSPGRWVLVAYELSVVAVLVVMFGFGVLFVLPGPVAAVGLRQLAGKEVISA